MALRGDAGVWPESWNPREGAPTCATWKLLRASFLSVAVMEESVEPATSSPCRWAGFPGMLPAALGHVCGWLSNRSALVPSSSPHHPQVISPAQLRSWDKTGNMVA